MIISGSDGLEFPDGSDQGTAFTGNAATITSGTIATARLATGTANSSTYLRGDQTWAAVPAATPGGSTTQVQYNNAGAFGGNSGFVYTGSNVGIGNTSPSTKLTIASASYQDHLLIDRTGVGSMQITASNPRGLAITDGTNVFLQIAQSNGNIGIGTSSPISDARLTISAPLEPILFFQRSDAGNNDAAIQVTSGGAFSFKNGADSSTAAGLTERVRIDGAGLFQFNSGYGSVATAYGCRAWVNFNGTGTVSIRASGNVTSITDNGTGLYQINFTTAMPDANYAVTVSGAGERDGSGGNSVFNIRAPSTNFVGSSSLATSSVQVSQKTVGGGLADSDVVTVSIFR
jgi:hypothetical protein